MPVIAIIVSFGIGVLASLGAGFLLAPMHDLLVAGTVRALGWLPRRPRLSLSGHWRATWHVQSTHYPPKVVDDNAFVRQFGRRFYAKFKSPTFDCYLVGTIDSGRYITGRWHDAAEGSYHGAFQFIIQCK
jgi:hypothetical protein